MNSRRGGVPSPKTEMVAVRATRDQVDAWELAALQADMSISEFIRRAATLYVEEQNGSR